MDPYFVKSTRWKAIIKNMLWLMNLLIFVSLAFQNALAITEAEKKDKIVEVLFNLKAGEADRLTFHDYNDYGEAADLHTGKCDGYEGGHSGWDVQTKNVAGNVPTVDEPFYSLTTGEVIGATENDYNIIAVYNQADDKTTLYLHARRINVSQGSFVKVGDRLGIQGNKGLNDNDPRDREHVHIEVRTGRTIYASCGAGARTRPLNIDPIDYLYESVMGSKAAPDLVVDNVSIEEGNTLMAGQTFTLRATVQNEGIGDSERTTLRYYRSTDSTILTDDIQVDTDFVSSLETDETDNERQVLNAPSEAGTYYYGACVDEVSGESNTSNNCSSSILVTVNTAEPVATTLTEISGNGQQNLPGAALASPFVVEVRDQSDSALAGVAITFAVAAGGGSLSTTNAITAANGRAQATLTLGSNTGTNTVSVSAAGISQVVTFNAEAVGESKAKLLSSTVGSIAVGGTFTLQLMVEGVTDFAGWQLEVAFNPAVLEAISVTEGDFLKKNGGNTLFQKGNIDNVAGSITGISGVSISTSGVSGTGTLLSINFKAKTAGEGLLRLEAVKLGSITGASIPYEIVIDPVIVEGGYDFNEDGNVDILDLLLVVQNFGKTNSQVDVNGDGTVNILDLITVALHLGESTTPLAPSVESGHLSGLHPTTVQKWIDMAHTVDDGSLAFERGIANLKRLLAAMAPEKTALFANYPNPFNPETWIPYHLANDGKVQLTIYDTQGTIVRQFSLGYQPVGYYTDKMKAAYWDGRNESGELVASGIYFYQLWVENPRSGNGVKNFSAIRRMVILK